MVCLSCDIEKDDLKNLLPHVIHFFLKCYFLVLFFPDCIGLNPQTYSSAAADSDYKNLTLKFYK